MSDETTQTTAIARREPTGVDRVSGSPYQPSDWGEMLRAAEFLSRANVVPNALRGKPADVAMVLLTGAERGMPVATALGMIHVVEGKITLAAEGLRALVLRSGCAEYLEMAEQSAEKVTWVTKRKGGRREQSVTWTMDDARRAGLANKSNWKSYPSAMLSARASAELCRAVYPDVCGGMYTPDEARSFSADDDAEQNTAPRRAIAAEVVNPTTGEVTETLQAPPMPADWTPPEAKPATNLAALLEEVGDPDEAWS